MTTRRIIRRFAAIVLGLTLGYLAAGSYAAPGSAPEHATHDSEHHATAADHLAVAPGDAPFYQNVLLAAAGLFVAAVVLGAPAEKFRGPLPPDPADAHGHGHDAHGHDAHGHDAHQH